MKTVAIFGPTAVGKTEVAIEVARLLRRERHEDSVAVSCDAIQIYEGLEIISGAPSAEQREALEHRLLGVASLRDEFSAGRFAELAHAEIDSLLSEGRRPILVGGTGLYMRVALTDLELRPPVDAAVRAGVEAEIEARGSAALHAEIEPELAAGIHPNDRKRVARTLELQRSGIEPAHTHEEGGRLWTAELRHPAVLVGITMDLDELSERIDSRVDAMFAAGARAEAEAALEAGASRTACAALGFDEFLSGDIDAVKSSHRAYARRQLTWLRRMDGVEIVDRTELADHEVAVRIISAL